MRRIWRLLELWPEGKRVYRPEEYTSQRKAKEALARITLRPGVVVVPVRDVPRG